MAINDSLSTVDIRRTPRSSRSSSRRFPVRDGEKPWTAREVKDVADELTSDIDRLTGELAAADAELSDLLRNSGDGAGDDQADSGSSALEREQELTLVNNTRDLLAQTTPRAGPDRGRHLRHLRVVRQGDRQGPPAGVPARDALRGVQAARGASLTRP